MIAAFNRYHPLKTNEPPSHYTFPTRTILNLSLFLFAPFFSIPNINPFGIVLTTTLPKMLNELT